MTRGGESFGVVPVPSALEADVLALDVPPLPQLLEESIPEARLRGWRATPKKTYPIDLRRLLGLGGARCGEEAHAHGAEEPAAAHHGGHL